MHQCVSFVIVECRFGSGHWNNIHRGPEKLCLAPALLMAARSRSPPDGFISRQDFLSRAIHQRGCSPTGALFDWWKLLNDNTPKVLHRGDTMCQDPLATPCHGEVPPKIADGQASIKDFFWQRAADGQAASGVRPVAAGQSSG